MEAKIPLSTGMLVKSIYPVNNKLSAYLFFRGEETSDKEQHGAHILVGKTDNK